MKYKGTIHSRKLTKIILLILFVFVFVNFPIVRGIASTEPSLKDAEKLENFSFLSNRQIIPADPGYVYMVNSCRVYRYDFIHDTEVETIYDSTYDGSQTSYFINGSIIYIQIQSSSDATTTHVEGFDILKQNLVYQGDFPIEQESDRRQQFVVDNSQNFYFKEGNKIVKSFDKNGTLIDTMTNDTFSTNLELVRVSANQKVLFHNGGPIYINNGKFVDGRAYRDSCTDSYNIFSEDTVYAVGQYGGVYKYTYSENKVTSTDIFHSLKGYGKLSGTTAFFYDDNIYLEGKDNQFLVYNTTTNSVTNFLNFEPDTFTTIQYVSIVDGNLYLLYTDYYGDMYKFEIALTEIPEVQNRELTDHVTYSYTKEEIIQKYKEAKPKFNYENSVYVEQPAEEAPYDEGKIEEQVLTDTLNQINFYRWQVGLNPVELSAEEEIQKSQKGALLMAVNDELNHFQTRPADMDLEFYQDASAACLGNLAYNSSLPSSVTNYVNDNNNVVNNIGHRYSILGIHAVNASMGYCRPYSTIYMHEDLNTTNGNNEDFYAFPSPGYMLADDLETDIMWSVTLSDEFSCPNLSEGKVTITVNNKTYPVSAKYDDGAKTFYYDLPSEVTSILTGDSDKYLPDLPATIEIVGIRDAQYNKVTLRYTTEFIYSEEKLIDSVRISQAESADSWILTTVNEGETLKLADVNEKCVLFIDPATVGATDVRYTVEVEDTSILTVEEDTSVDEWYKVFELNLLKEGSTNIIIRRTADGQIIRTQKVQIGEPLLKGDMDKNGRITPYDALLINVIYEQRRTPTAEELEIGDIDGNGRLTPYDALLINVAYENRATLD